MIRLRQIHVSIQNSETELLEKCKKKLRIKSIIKNYKIVKKSIDARNKGNIFYSYEVDVEVQNEEEVLKKNKSKDVFKTPNEEYIFNISGNKKLNNNPVIIGAGPAGLFSAYMLAKYGYNPIIIERGEKIENRIKTVEDFWNNNNLNLNSNVQFGEGGAGTFSDGKLNTQVKDKFFRNKKVLEIFVQAGAPKEILYLNKPHIGTDKLREVVKNLREKIIQMGGTFRYNSLLTDIIIKDSKVKEIIINDNEKINTEVLIIAIGHSARDTFRMLYKKNIVMEPKPFAVGVRVQHCQEMINNMQYGNMSEFLEPAPYKLTFRSYSGRGVYSFCMCPGGYVVNASSEKDRLVINGMSNYKRESKYANSAIVVTVNPSDFRNELFGGMEFQESLESKAFFYGKGKIPVQKLEDFVNNKTSDDTGEINAIFKGKYNYSNLNNILPNFITDAIKEAFINFDKKIPGFANKNTILAAVETRTSSPVRIVRDENFQTNIEGIYPIGEGAGYAGGIMSAAMDGLKAAEQIAKKYRN